MLIDRTVIMDKTIVNYGGGNKNASKKRIRGAFGEETIDQTD